MCTSMKAELKALYRGLQLAKSMNIEKLWVQLDSLVVVSMLNGNNSWSREHEPLMDRCKKLIQSQDWEIKISHCYRETNQVVDKLDNMRIDLISSCNILSSLPKRPLFYYLLIM